MLLRTLIAFALCLATFAGSVLGLGNGMVLVVHDDGHVGIEYAHLRHAHEHADGANHDDHDYGADSDHAALHAAILADVDSCPPRPAQQQADSAQKHVIHLRSIATAALPPLNVPLLVSGQTRHDDIQGIIARRENARLRSVVLVI